MYSYLIIYAICNWRQSNKMMMVFANRSTLAHKHMFYGEMKQDPRIITKYFSLTISLVASLILVYEL